MNKSICRKYNEKWGYNLLTRICWVCRVSLLRNFAMEDADLVTDFHIFELMYKQI